MTDNDPHPERTESRPEEDDSSNRLLILALVAVVAIPVVIGVVVILAAVVGTFVLGIGADQTVTPQAAFDFEWDGETVTITHEAGDRYDSENVGETGTTCDEPGLGITVQGRDTGCWPAPVTPGDTIDVGGGGDVAHDLDGGERVRVIWQAPGGGASQTVASYQVPG